MCCHPETDQVALQSIAMRLFIYTNNLTSHVIFQVAARNVLVADQFFHSVFDVHPRALKHVGVVGRSSHLPEGCVVGEIGTPHSKTYARKAAIYQDRHDGANLAHQWHTFRGRLPLERKIEFSNRCFYCGVSFGQAETKTRDHIYPRSKGGKQRVLACHPCNQHKASLTVDEFRYKVFGKSEEFFAEFAMRTASNEYEVIFASYFSFRTSYVRKSNGVDDEDSLQECPQG